MTTQMTSLTKEEKAEVKRLIAEVPDVDDPTQINYWRHMGDKLVYLEGWSDECLAGTGFPPMEEGGTAGKIHYIEDLTPGILREKAKEYGLTLLKGGFKELEEADNLYGVTWGVYKGGNPMGEEVPRSEITKIGLEMVTALRGAARGLIVFHRPGGEEIEDWTPEEMEGVADMVMEDLETENLEGIESLRRLYQETGGQPFKERRYE